MRSYAHSVLVSLFLAVSFVTPTNAQVAKSSAQPAPCQERLSALEKEVRTLRAENATLRKQLKERSASSPAVSSSGGLSGGAPTQAEIQACLNTTDDDRARGYGSIQSIQYGTPMTSQGGMMELAMGAPKGTVIYPVKLSFGSESYSNWKAWIFRDSFGELKCKRQ